VNREELDTPIRVHQAALYRYARYLGSERADAEDIFQETFKRRFWWFAGRGRSRMAPAPRGGLAFGRAAQPVPGVLSQPAQRLGTIGPAVVGDVRAALTEPVSARRRRV
jgi:hypothetical protein